MSIEQITTPQELEGLRNAAVAVVLTIDRLLRAGTTTTAEVPR